MPKTAFSFEEYLAEVERFHGYAAPGLLVGGFMVELAKRLTPPDILYDAISETKSCLPDAIQLLTPCTVGNGWLRVYNLGRYALTLYDKREGTGVRVFLDPAKLEAWPHIKTWLFLLKDKKDQDSPALQEEIRRAGDSVCSVRTVRIRLSDVLKKRKDRIALCPLCQEPYPPRDGAICRGCQGEIPYENGAWSGAAWSSPDEAGRPAAPQGPPAALAAVPLAEAVGKTLLHDMTEIIPDQSKEAVFKRGQTITAGDLCRLQHMGKLRVYVQENTDHGPDWVHEDDAARAFAQAMAGEGLAPQGPPREGKVNLTATRPGLFLADVERLEAFNLVPGVMCACRQSHSMVETGMRLAGTRSIPLLLPRSDFDRAMALLGAGPLFRIAPLRRAKVGVLVTGSEVFQGLVEDKFIPVITSKVEKLGSTVVATRIAPDDAPLIRQAALELLAAGADLIVTTAGLSVDPDDVTRQALLDCGLEDMLFGAPILPGAMTLLGRLEGAQVLGAPACALFHKTTSLDLLLPRLLAGLRVTRRDLAALGHGAMCLECRTCTYPKCAFGR